MATRNVSVLALYKDGKVLLQHRSKDAPRLPDHWGFFGGGIEGQETPEEALRRELSEELSYKVKNPVFLFVQDLEYKGDKNKKYIFVEKYDESQSLVQHEGQGMNWWGEEDLGSLLIIEHDRTALPKIFSFIRG